MLEGGRVVAIGRSQDLLDREPVGGATLLEGRVLDQDPDLALARVDTPAGVLLIPAQDIAAGAHVRVRIRCDDAMIATAGGELAIGALNVLPGVLVSLAPGDGPFEQARVRCGAAEIEVRTPRGFTRRAGVTSGDAVRLVLREASLSLTSGGA
jgi:molybdate transport system ATP-binding protein